MIIDIIHSQDNKLGEIISLKVGQVVVRTDNGTPIFVAMAYGENSYNLAKLGDHDFHSLLAEAGVTLRPGLIDYDVRR